IDILRCYASFDKPENTRKFRHTDCFALFGLRAQQFADGSYRTDVEASRTIVTNRRRTLLFSHSLRRSAHSQPPCRNRKVIRVPVSSWYLVTKSKETFHIQHPQSAQFYRFGTTLAGCAIVLRFLMGFSGVAL